MTINIINEPSSAKYYEFVVAVPHDDGNYVFIGEFDNGYEAEKVALAFRGIIFHNLRINGYEPPMKKYRITLTHSEDIEAPNEEEAINKFNHNLDNGESVGELQVEEFDY